ncbi:MAG: LysR family transcriptional regulator [Myxococcota bacterium]
MNSLNELDLNLLVALRALLQERSVTKAARSLGMSQPAMSHKLQKLRAALDDPLFVPAGRGLSPTPRAEQIQQRLEDALSALEHVVREDQFDPKTVRRTLAIGSADYGVACSLPKMFAAVQREAPGLEFVVRRVGPDLVQALDRGIVDLAFGAGMRIPTGAKQLLLYREGFEVLCRADHPTVQEGLSLDTYLACSHVVVSPRGEPGTFVDSALSKKDARPRKIAIVVASFLAAPFIVAETDALLTAPTGLANALAPLLGLSTHPVPFEIPEVPIFMVWHSRFHEDPVHAWFRNVVRERMHQ